MKTKLFVLTAFAATLMACASSPDRNTVLDESRVRFDAAKSNPQVTTLAPEELKRAEDSLIVADKAWNDRDEKATVDHLAYMAGQRVTIAQETAASRAAQAVTANASAERDKLRIAVRTNEADRAQQQLALSEQNNAQKATALAVADATAQRDQERMSDLETQLKELNAKKTDRGMIVTLGDVLFDSGKSQIRASGAGNLTKLAEVLKRNQESRASIEGYTDSVGSAASNHALSERRANAVMAALVNLGVPSDRLSTRAHGQENPTADNGTAAGRQMNRRVEIVFAPSS